MSDTEKSPAGVTTPDSSDRPQNPALSNDFYARLLHLPTCKTQGYCSDCGRCER